MFADCLSCEGFLHHKARGDGSGLVGSSTVDSPDPERAAQGGEGKAFGGSLKVRLGQVIRVKIKLDRPPWDKKHWSVMLRIKRPSGGVLLRGRAKESTGDLNREGALDSGHGRSRRQSVRRVLISAG